MSKLTLGCVIILKFIALFALSGGAYAQSEAKMPPDWKNWPVTASGKITGVDITIPADAPPILRDTLKAYNWVNDGKGSSYEVRVNPKAMEAYSARNGKYPDGLTAILYLSDINAMLITEHVLGQPFYGVSTVDGKDIASAHPSLTAQVCRTCHTGYSDICIGGLCSSKR